MFQRVLEHRFWLQFVKSSAAPILCPRLPQNDIIAGLSVAFMAVPQSLSYANSAGLPAVFGLYGCFTPCLAYAVLGTSRQLAVGPVAVTSLLIASKLKQIVPGSSSITNPNSPDSDQVCFIAGF